MSFLDTPIQKSALSFAKDAHKGQVRKGTKRPYINHCMEVARIIHKNGYPEEYVVAALLHDTVEDTEATLEDIRDKFGNDVVEIVKYVTADMSPSLTWSQRKIGYIKNLSDAPEGSIVVSAADKLHNITETFEQWIKVGDSVFLIFNAGKEQQKWYYRSLTDLYFVRSLFFDNRSLIKMTRSINKVLGKMGM